MGIIRSTFLIDPDGRIARVWPKVKATRPRCWPRSARSGRPRRGMTEEAPEPAPAEAPHDWRPARFMVIAAHPDDADFGPAMTAARWIDEGSVGWLVCCTSGDQGGEDPDMDPLELAAIREREQRAAAEVVGYAGVSFLHMPDGALVNDLILREHLVREIARSARTPSSPPTRRRCSIGTAA